MKKLFLSIALISSFTVAIQAQKYFTKEGKINFHAGTSVEDIDGTSNTATCVIDSKTGDIQWSVLVKGFHFDRALMEEHFNETYMESNTYDKATFKGKIDNISSVNFTKDGTYAVKVSGDLTMHGVTKKITVDGTIAVKGGVISCNAKFYVNPKDYNINIPSAVQDKITNNIEINVSAALAELKK
ncbi:MAG: YceI family protein [Flavobacteriales bacterium]